MDLNWCPCCGRQTPNEQALYCGPQCAVRDDGVSPPLSPETSALVPRGPVDPLCLDDLLNRSDSDLELNSILQRRAGLPFRKELQRERHLKHMLQQLDPPLRAGLQLQAHAQHGAQEPTLHKHRSPQTDLARTPSINPDDATLA